MNIQQVIKKYKTIGEVTKIVTGKKFKYKIGTPNSNSGLSVNSIITVNSCTGSLQAPYYGAYNCNTDLGLRTIHGCEFQDIPETIEELEKEIVALETTIKESKNEIKSLDIKIKFMKDNNLTEFDETDFKVFETLSLLEDKSLSKVEMAKAIAKLVKG